MNEPVKKAIEWMRNEVRVSNLTIDEAARRFRTICPVWHSEVLDIIGMYPSSEPELRALQKAF